MHTISYTSARGNLSKTMERVCDDHAPIIITRKSKQPVVMMSMEDYESQEETSYLLKSPNNALRTLDSIIEISSGYAQAKEILEMACKFSEHAWNDYLYWKRTNRKTFRRVTLLLHEIEQTPYEGIGKPEPLMHSLTGYWARRISGEHRLVYKLEENTIFIAQVRYHY